jgi:hypothetical protein
MSTSLLKTKLGDSSSIKTNAPHQLIQSKNYNECDYLMSMLSEHCTLGASFAKARHVEKLVTEKLVTEKLVTEKLVTEKLSCGDISLLLERCILDGHDCNNNLYKFNVLCKGDVDTKL